MGEIWRGKDWASDRVVLKLCSLNTVRKLVPLAQIEEKGSVAALIGTLYFIRLHLYAVNAKNVPFNVRIIGLWSSLIFLTSTTRSSKLGTNQANMLTNRRNLTTE